VKNIVLIGFMGSGKSTVGKLLANKLGLRFVDTDRLVEKKVGKRIKEIFKNEGEEKFRAFESEVIEEVSKYENQVISCGGGAVLNPDNVSILKENGVLIYLKASAFILFERLHGTDTRPLLNVASPRDKVNELLAARQSLYEKVTDILIDTSYIDVDAVVKKIQEKIDDR